MKFFKMQTTGFLLAFILSACSTSNSPSPSIDRADPRYATLLKMALPDFYGTLSIASKVSNDCSGLQRNSRIDSELNEQRNKQGNGSFAALTQRQAIRDAQDSMSQGFKSRHGSDLCNVAERDYGQAKKPYTFFLTKPSQG